MKFFIYLTCFLLFISYSCNNNKKNDYFYKLEISEDKIFQLDSETVQETNLIQLLVQNDTLLFTFANEYDNSIVLYDYLSNRFISKIKFEKEGPNGVGHITSYYYHSYDSIYIFNQWLEKIFLLNHQAKKQNEFVFNVRTHISSELSPPSPYPLTVAPIQKISDILIFPGIQVSNDDNTFRPSTILYNLNTNDIKFVNNLPKLYKSMNWGHPIVYNYANTTFNKNKIILSLGADHNITVYDIEKDENKTFNAATKHYSDIKSFHLPENTDFQAMNDHYMSNLCYRNILFDCYRNVYYRFACLPHPNYNKEDKYLRRPISVIILDSEFNIVGETLLPEFEYLILQTFVSPDGLQIQILSDDDDYMIFKTFKLVEL